MTSYVAIDRMAEGSRRNPATPRNPNKIYRSDALSLTDDQLLARLALFDIHMDRPTLERYCDQALSAQEIAEGLLPGRVSLDRQERFQSDWIWVALCALWQRWFPDKPSFEWLDDKIHAGYDLLESSGSVECCRLWLDAWSGALQILDKAGIGSIEGFDERFQGSHFFSNWIQDLEAELWTAGTEDRELLAARIEFCEETLRRFGVDRDLMTENFRRAVAESHYELGNAEHATALFRGWLDADPKWGWGWIGYSDLYRFTSPDRRDPARCEQILREGFAIQDVRDRWEIGFRLAEALDLQGQGQSDEWTQVLQQAQQSQAEEQEKDRLKSLDSSWMRRLSEPRDLHLPTPIVKPLKVGRNDPCPCGSGKKYKKCCGG